MQLRELSALALAAALAACSGPSDSNGDEPNDTIAQATQIGTNASVDATIATPYDVDFYRFTVPGSGAFVRVQTFDAGGATCLGVDTYVDLVEADGTPFGSVIAWDDDSGPNYCEDLVEWLPAGIYYVAVGFGGATPPGFAYELRVTQDLPDVGDSAEAEPNGSRVDANGPYTADTLVGGSISTTTDEDWFEITNTAGYARTVYVETFEYAVGYCPAADSTLDLYDAAGYWVAYDDETGVNSCSKLTITLPAYATAYVAVGGWSGDMFSYLFEIDFL